MKKQYLLALILFSCFNNLYSQNSTFKLYLKVFLEGPYTEEQDMHVNNTIPLDQPFSPDPWDYNGSESVTEIPANIVDWILVELRDTNDFSIIKKTRAGFVSNDGRIVDLDGVSPLEFNILPDKYFVAIKHRNHLGIMSATWITPNTEHCPATIEYMGEVYNTILIGEQCWMRENLNVGTMVTSDGPGYEQSDNGIIEKFCYDNNEENCMQFGGLYEWPEAMQYVSTEGAKGICPPGWHIPSKSEWQTLVSSVSSQAEKLIDQNAKSGFTYSNESGFSALFSGHVDNKFGTSTSKTISTNFWVSTEEGLGAHAGSYSLFYNNNQIFFGSFYKDYAFCIRCVKD